MKQQLGFWIEIYLYDDPEIHWSKAHHNGTVNFQMENWFQNESNQLSSYLATLQKCLEGN